MQSNSMQKATLGRSVPKQTSWAVWAAQLFDYLEVMHTATTRLIPHHVSSDKTILESMQDRFDYGKNPKKTLDGALILLSKAKYKTITGREQKRDADVLCYQIRQSFSPGELDPEAALEIGYELAMRWTMGKHAYFCGVPC